MYSCSNLTHFNGLIAPEKMLACEASSLKGESLCSLLSDMDKKEWKVLNTEEDKLQFKISRVETYIKIGILIGGFVTGVTIAMGTLAVAPFAAPPAGAATFYGVTKAFEISMERDHNLKSGLIVNSDRLIRLREKISDLKWRASEIKASANTHDLSLSPTDANTQGFWSIQTILRVFRYFYNYLPQQAVPNNAKTQNYNNVELMQLNKALIYFSEGSESIDP